MSGGTAGEVDVTGIGLLSSVGAGRSAHLRALHDGHPHVDAETFAPVAVHPLAEPDWGEHIPRREARQMGRWQRIGTYAAGLALADAGLGGEALAETDLVVAAAGAEQDREVREAILRDAPGGEGLDAERSRHLAKRLRDDLRPTLFLAQLPNLLAGNISIVHGVTGSSRTFLGEEEAGMTALHDAHARIASGQSERVLVGAAFFAELPHTHIEMEAGGCLAHGAWAPVWDRAGKPGEDREDREDRERHGGMMLGSMGAFVVLEARAAAERRGAAPKATFRAIALDRGAADRRAERLAAMLPHVDCVLSGASGTAAATRAERCVLEAREPGPLVRAHGSLLGHGVQAQMVMGVALAALMLEHDAPVAPIGALERATDFEQAKDKRATGEAPSSIATTALGPDHDEGVAVLERAR